MYMYVPPHVHSTMYIHVYICTRYEVLCISTYEHGATWYIYEVLWRNRYIGTRYEVSGTAGTRLVHSTIQYQILVLCTSTYKHQAQTKHSLNVLLNVLIVYTRRVSSSENLS